MIQIRRRTHRMLQKAKFEQSVRVFPPDFSLQVVRDKQLVKPPSHRRHLFIGIIDRENHTVIPDLPDRLQERLRVIMTARRQPEIRPEIIAGPAFRSCSSFAIALFVQSVLLPWQ